MLNLTGKYRKGLKEMKNFLLSVDIELYINLKA